MPCGAFVFLIYFLYVVMEHDSSFLGLTDFADLLWCRFPNGSLQTWISSKAEQCSGFRVVNMTVTTDK